MMKPNLRPRTILILSFLVAFASVTAFRVLSYQAGYHSVALGANTTTATTR